MDSANNGIDLKGSEINAHLTSAFTFKYLFITASGTADITISKIGFELEIDSSTQPGIDSHGLAPAVKAQTVNFNINPDNVDIKLHGGAVTKIASILIPLLKKTITTTVAEQL